MLKDTIEMYKDWLEFDKEYFRDMYAGKYDMTPLEVEEEKYDKYRFYEKWREERKITDCEDYAKEHPDCAGMKWFENKLNYICDCIDNMADKLEEPCDTWCMPGIYNY